MIFIQLDDNKKIIKYPFTADDLINFKSDFSTNIITNDHFYLVPGVQGVHEVQKPQCKYNYNVVEDIPEQRYPNTWFQTWKIVPASEEEIAERTNIKSDEIRQQRDQLLIESDWTQLPDVPASIREPHQSYRQALRDITDQPDFPWNINWPTKP